MKIITTQFSLRGMQMLASVNFGKWKFLGFFFALLCFLLLPTVNAVATDNDGDGINDNIDCDPLDPLVNWAYSWWYFDSDGDTFGDINTKSVSRTCAKPTGYVLDKTDCDDTNAEINPLTDWYKDADGDLYSDGTTVTDQCIRPASHFLASELTATSGDCDDSLSSVHPGLTEICDGLDNDCNGLTDEVNECKKFSWTMFLPAITNVKK